LNRRIESARESQQPISATDAKANPGAALDQFYETTAIQASVHWLRIAVSARTYLVDWRASATARTVGAVRENGIRSRRFRHRDAPYRGGGAPGASRRVALAL